MQLTSMILQNFTTLCLMAGLGIIIICNKNFDKKTNRVFVLLFLIIISLVIEGMLDKYFEILPSPSVWRYPISALGYTLRPTVIALFITISMRRRKHSVILWIPIMVLAIISFTDYFTHIMFWYSENNHFCRGPLTYLAHVMSAAYLLIFMLIVIERRRTITNTETFAIYFSSFICVLSTILETVLSDYRFFITDAMAVSMTLYYMVLYTETFRIDVVTGLLNRRSLSINMKKKSNKSFIVIAADLNGLKEINDTRGHAAGDQALKDLADTLIEESKNDYLPYRTGGDEFILIGREQEETEVNLFIEKMRNSLKEKNIMASFGWALYRPGDSFDDICNIADQHMYDDKRHYRNRMKT